LGGIISSADITAMKDYLMNQNGRLFLSGFRWFHDIKLRDPAFLEEYLHVSQKAIGRVYKVQGFEDNPLAAGTSYRYESFVPNTNLVMVNALGDASPAFYDYNYPDSVVGVTYSGNYKTVLLTFPFEYISDDFEVRGHQPKDTLLNRIIEFFDGTQTGIYDGSGFAALPRNFDLNQNYPNPFNPSTTISYTLRAANDGGRPARTRLTLYNALGQRVRTLVDKVQLPGNYTVEWNGRNSSGDRVASGVYLYRLTRGSDNLTKKMVLLK
ncbi:MAG: T9SS type A sorting domain-containing protein, partial [candidate division Zixibacteria bacterium]|nr:T9SS type A sorting domain-containing protein [candidate division Zixibacteria bacterium]